MIRVKRAERPPADGLVPYGAEEFMEMSKNWRDFHRDVVRMWDISENERYLGTFGISKGSLMGTGARFWILVGEGLPCCSQRAWRVLRRMMDRLVRLFGHVTVYVKCDYRAGSRLVRFFGFKRAVGVDGFEVWERWRL